MNRLSRRLAFALVLLCVASAWAQTPPGKPGVSGKVTDKAGKPIANATVQLVGPDYQQARTDAQGNYTVRINRAGEYRIGAEAQGFLTIEYWGNGGQAMQLSPDGSATHDLVLERGATFVVTVTDSAGQPIRGASVDANLVSGEGRTGARRSPTDDSGTAMVTVAPSKKEYIITAVHDGFAPAHTTATVESIDNPVDVALALEPGATVKGVAICNDGKPASGWEIYAQPEWWLSPYIEGLAKIDAKGNFTLKDLSPGVHKLRLLVRMANGGGQIKDLPMTINVPVAEQPLRLDLPMASPASLIRVTGKVRVTGGVPESVQVNANGAAAAGQYLYAHVEFPPAGKPGAAKKDTVIEGRYTFEGIPAGTYQFNFQSADTEAKTLEQVKVPGEVPLVELKMVGRPHLAGQVLDPAGKPVTTFSIRSRKLQHLGNGPNYNDEARWMQVSRPEGKFDLELKSPGVYQVQVLASGYALATTPETRLENGDAKSEVTIKLTAGGTLSGMIADPAGKPVAGAEVIPFSIAGNAQMLPMERFLNGMGAVKTDAAGRFVLEHRAAGEERVRVVHPEFAPRVFRGLKVTEAQSTDVGSLALTPGGTVEGVVYDGQGKPAAEAQLEFRDSEGYYGGEDESTGRLAMVTSGEDGKFRVEHLPELPVYVSIPNSWNREGLVRRIIRPIDGRTTHIDFGGTKPLKGKLLGTMGPLPAGTRLQLGGPVPYSAPVMFYAKIDATGQFAFYGVPAGKYTLYCMSETDTINQNWTAVKKLEVTEGMSNLGDITPAGGEVVITVQADDPADLAAVKAVYLRLADQEALAAMAKAEGDQPGKWRAKGVAPGKYRLTTSGQTAATYSTLVECSPASTQTAVTLHLPKASATLSVTIPRAPATAGNLAQMAMLSNDDQSVTTYLNSGTGQPRTIKLPPGTYRVLDYSTWQVREDIAPITLKEGKEKSIEVNLATPERTAARLVTLLVWSAEGALLPDAQPRIVDATGKTMPPPRYTYQRPAYVLQPGHYRAVLERTGAEAVTKEFDVVASDGLISVDLFVP